ncbi:MAG: hypothetical protein HFG97_12020 [Dorea sp.]|jgi:NB-ARC domain./Protein kinase domain.|nr:hypothetical protein [Dorea sp.]
MSRKGLGKGSILSLDKEYVIQEEIGRGASCLVYDGFYTDPSDGTHRVRIKECFPYHIMAERDSQGRIIPTESWRDAFEKAKNIFSDAYIRNTKIRNTMGLTNATIDSLWKQEKNNTVYSVMSYLEGKDYGKYEEKCLKDIFTRMKRLCKIIGDYHKEGCLHLDIKPENIFIPSDTKEQIVLFDFDSLTELENLREGKEVRLSCSEGFSALELVLGDRKKICMATDVYSIGAVIFYKMFGRTPEIQDRRWNARYDFAAIGFPDKRYQPKLFQKMTDFFHKTLSNTVSMRYQNMKDVIAVLEELEKLSDVEGVMLLDSFSYYFSQFVGRKDEILKIKNALDEKDVVFLSGMGGIGKTELAKKFADEYRDQFNRIVFLRFTDSIMETVCSEEFVIAKCDMEKQESFSDFYKRKMAGLKKDVGKDDLIILDNFDKKNKEHIIEEDEHFNDLIHCGCKLLFTTREDFWEEYGYSQIDIGPLENDLECKALFRKNNSKEYAENEWDAIGELFHLFEHHTMVIALFAKYLLHTEQAPSELLRQIRQKEGMASAVNPPVRHNKDDMRRERQIYIHLEMLFDLSDFTELEAEIMRSLSSLGAIRIKKSIFARYFKSYSGMEGYLDNLVERGWIECDEKTDKISLHQIVLDLAYNSLKPTSQNCPDIVYSMISYFKRKEENFVDIENRRKLAEYFIERMGGSDLLLAELYYEYCRNIKYEEKILKRAQQICKEEDSLESDILQVKIHHLEIKSFIRKIKWLDIEDERIESVLEDVYGKVFGLERDIFANLRNAILRKEVIPKRTEGIVLPEIKDGEQQELSDVRQFMQEMEERQRKWDKVACAVFEDYIEGGYSLMPYVNDTLVHLYLETAEAVETLGNGICESFLWQMEYAFFGLKNIYSDAERIYLYTCKLAEQDFIGYEVKKDVYEKLENFYGEDDFLYVLRSACVGDKSKSTYYSEKLTALSGENSYLLNKEIISYMDAADQAWENGKYEDALVLCQKAMERQKGYTVDIQCEMSRSYIKLKEYEKAETVLLEALRKARECDICDVLERMVKLYEAWKNTKKVVEYCERIIQNQRHSAEEGNIEAITRVLTFSIKKAKWEGDGEIRLKEKEYLMWNKYFQILNNCRNLSSILVEAYCEYAKYCWKTGQPEEALELLFSAAEKYRKGFGQNSSARELYECILRDKRFWNIRKDLYVRSALGDAENYLEIEGGMEAASICRYVEELLKEDVPDSEYIEAVFRKVDAASYDCFGDVWLKSYDYDEYIKKRKQCNYYLLADRESGERDNPYSAFDVWKDAVDDYMYIDNYDMAGQCLERMEQEAERVGSMPCFQTYYSKCFELDRREDARERIMLHTKALYGRLIQYVQCDTERVDDTLCLQILETIRENAFEYKAYDTALSVGLLSVSILLDEHWMSKIQAEELPEDEICLKDYISRMKEIFPQKIDKGKVDEVLHWIDKILEGIEENTKFEEFYTKLSEIGKRYKTEQVEFK